MSLPLPQIDNVEFEELVEQSRGLIPRYAEGWTDHNVHDPGMMLIELASWIVEQQIFTAGFVSDEHFAAFAALLGVRSEPAQSARGLIWPDNGAVANDVTTTGVNLAATALAVARQQPEVLFRTSAAIHLTPATIINSTDTTQLSRTRAGGTSEIVAQEIVFDRPLVEGPNPLSYPIALGIELASVIPASELNGAEGRLAVDYRLEASDQYRSIDPWQRLDIVSDTTFALNQNGVLLLKVPSTDLQSDWSGKRRARLRIRLRYRINPLPPRLRRIAINVVPVEQCRTISAGLIATGSGQPNQKLPFYANGIDSSQMPIIEVAESGHFTQWQRVDNFNRATPDDRVYVLDEITGTLHFGNGVNGAIPSNEAQIRHLDYAVTDGSSGNLAANLDWSITGVQLNTDAEQFGSNIQPMLGGSDSWNADELRAAARHSATDRLALISNEDLDAVGDELAMLGVAHTEVLVGFDPARPHSKTPGTRTLLVTPNATLAGPLESYLSAVRRVVIPRRVLGERLIIAIKTETVIDIDVSILIEDGSDAQIILTNVTEVLTARFSSLRRNDRITPWGPGRNVMNNDIEKLIANVSGVVSVTSCRFARSGKDLDSVPVLIDRDSVAVLGKFSLTHHFCLDRGA